MSNTGEGNSLDLKACRESRGLTIEAIYNVTKVRPAFLEAIENGRYEILPERIYSEAFIKSYAAQIGVDPEGILARYRKFLKVPEPGKAPEKKPEKKTDKRKDEVKPAAAAPEPKAAEPAKSPEAMHALKSALPVQRKRFSRVAISLSLTVLVVCGGFLYFLLSDDTSGPEVLMKAEKPAAPAATDAKDVKPAETPQQPAAEQPSTSAVAPAPPGQGAPAAETKPAAASNKLVIHANELTWISVTEDGGPPYQIMLRPGDNLERNAGKFVLDIGNAGGIVVNFNGADMGMPGRSGQVVHLILPQETPQPREASSKE